MPVEQPTFQQKLLELIDAIMRGTPQVVEHLVAEYRLRSIMGAVISGLLVLALWTTSICLWQRGKKESALSRAKAAESGKDLDDTYIGFYVIAVILGVGGVIGICAGVIPYSMEAMSPAYSLLQALRNGK